jgi:hypothetical protein
MLYLGALHSGGSHRAWIAGCLIRITSAHGHACSEYSEGLLGDSLGLASFVVTTTHAFDLAWIVSAAAATAGRACLGLHWICWLVV